MKLAQLRMSINIRLETQTGIEALLSLEIVGKTVSLGSQILLLQYHPEIAFLIQGASCLHLRFPVALMRHSHIITLHFL